MAVSKCPFCKAEKFEMATIEPAGAEFKVNVIQCSACGAPLGALPAANVAAVLAEQTKLIRAIASKHGLLAGPGQ
jgi:hypothetical protein